MRLVEAFRLDKHRRIAFVGAGGKTTAIFRLAEEAQQQGEKLVLVAATTHLGAWQTSRGDTHTVLTTLEDVLNWQPTAGVHVFTGPPVEEARLAGVPLVLMDALAQIAKREGGLLLVEADGSRQKPLKAPAEHEPVIPSWVDEVVVVAGMSGLGQPLDDAYIHRPERFAAFSGLDAGQPVSVEGLAKVLLNALGGLKEIPETSARTVLLNQCDSDLLGGQAAQLAGRLLPKYGQVILAHLAETGEQSVLSVRRRVAGVVLAAGGSGRMGQPKQLLDWFGKPFVRVVTETAVASGLGPVLVVTGAAHEQVEAAIADLPVQIVRNHGWEQGQSTSVRAVMEAIGNGPDAPLGAIFFLVDQPQIPVRLVQTLLDAYAESLPPVVAPLVDDRRGNPVLFDGRTFEALRGTVGDAGGRQVFSCFRVAYIPCLDAAAGMDVDTPEDYEKLLAHFGGESPAA
ncbi:putative selenium-dependent hydroxylase accessory protein YqeC [bacterium]|nr:putative selenium-dependent hydroxylase accessory protein YqeC [bacterium]MCB2179420.1 putative selenium-dependent hydroxylase accessory protein YqeC [bacterium]